MSNMSYCKFQNTVMDLQDCADDLQNKTKEELEDELSEDEFRACKRLIDVCKDIAEMFEDDNE